MSNFSELIYSKYFPLITMAVGDLGRQDDTRFVKMWHL
jgi:hypothetical protein